MAGANMTKHKTDAVAVSSLETRIYPKAEAVCVKPPAPCNWAERQVIPLKQDGPWDTSELLFVGLCGEFKPISV